MWSYHLLVWSYLILIWSCQWYINWLIKAQLLSCGLSFSETTLWRLPAPLYCDMISSFDQFSTSDMITPTDMIWYNSIKILYDFMFSSYQMLIWSKISKFPIYVIILTPSQWYDDLQQITSLILSFHKSHHWYDHLISLYKNP